MDFINRENERNSFKNEYEKNVQNDVSQVYIIEAKHGVGKSEFIREVSKYFSYCPLEIVQSDNSKEISIFKRMVLELDKASAEYGYDDFNNFYEKKINNVKVTQLLLKITKIFGQVLAKCNGVDVEFGTFDTPIPPKKFILNAQIENLFEYSQYVFSKVHMHVIFHDTLIIDAGSLDLLSKLIALSKGSVFIFESDNNESSSRIEHYLKNTHSIFVKKYLLNQLSDDHIQDYIRQLSVNLKLDAKKVIDSSILRESIEKGDLSEITSILKDYNDRLKKGNSIRIRSMKEIIHSLSNEQSALLILIGYANKKLDLKELRDVITELNGSFTESDIDFLLSKNLIEKNGDFVSLTPFVYEIFNEKEYMPALKYTVASALIKYLNTSLISKYNTRYVDILIEYYLDNKQYYQLKSLLPHISLRLKNFNTQAERVDYFEKFVINRQEIRKTDRSFPIKFAYIAYNANLYFQAMKFIELVGEENEDMIFVRAITLNRCEDFNQSKKYIKSKLSNLDQNSSIYFKLSLVLMMNLIQLNEREQANTIFNELVSYTKEPLYPYLIRLSNVFYNDYMNRLEVVKSITNDFYKTNDNEFSGLHAIYLAYLFALTKQPEEAEKSLSKAREFFGENLIYNHMILHNEATIKFHTGEIDEDIPVLLNNAKITAYDEYDRFAIDNNLLVYYILSNNLANFECQNIALELEKMLSNTSFKRFVDKIYYNLYFYYKKMFNLEKSEHYKSKLVRAGIECQENYYPKLMYETSWKLPIMTESFDI